MVEWVQDRNVFVVRQSVHPERKEEFIALMTELLTFAAPFYERGCTFAFQGFSRDPNEWIAIASWDEEVARELRKEERFQELNAQMLDCCTAPMRFEYFAGIKTDRSVFDDFPLGLSQVHAKGKQNASMVV